MKVDNKVPIPKPLIKYPFAEMKIGDSFFVDGGDTTKVGNAAASYGKRHGTKYTCRKNAVGVRCWRIK